MSAALASTVTAFARKPDGTLGRAQLATAKTLEELIAATRAHFKADRALALILTERLPKA